MDVDSINKDIGRRIRNLRNRNGLTQQELADRTELTKGFISQLERGQVSASVATLMDLIECLGTTPAEFFEDEEPQVGNSLKMKSRRSFLRRRNILKSWMSRATADSGSCLWPRSFRWSRCLW